MTKTQLRRLSGVHIPTKKRRKMRNMLRHLYGDNCCWCGKPMVFPEPGEVLDDLENMATIEHHFGKKEGKPSLSFLLRLAHKKCNV